VAKAQVRAPADSEAAHHEALVAACRLLTPRLPALAWLVHVPNGEYRPKTTAARLQRMGVQPGVPDFLLFWASGPQHVGLALELKRPSRQSERDGGVSRDQARWLDHLESQGWCCVIAWSAEEALTEILRYLGVNPDDYVVGLD
jgi:hypothetical protein